MDKLFKKLRPFIQWVERYAGLVVAVLAALAVLGGSYAIRLTIDSDISKLLPPDYQSVQALDKLRETVGGESEASVVIESPSFEDNKRFAEALIPRILALTGEGQDEPYFTHAEYRKDVSFLQRNALYFTTDEELDSLENYLEDKIEEAKLDANPFFFDLEEEEETGPDSSELALKVTYDRLIGQEYPISDDSTTMVVRFYPSGAQTDIDFIRSAYADLQKVVDEMQPASYNAEMEITLAGRLLRQLIEVDAIMEDVAGSFGAGVATVILMVVAYFAYKSYRARAGRRFSARILLHELLRSPITAIVIALPLLASLCWTFGLVYLVYGSLNLMTSALALILFGMGIDYGIHFYGRYAEERGAGMSVAEAVEHTFIYTGQAIATTALTTAAAFYVLMFADFRGFSEFGFISGTGILFALIAMIILMPAVLVLLERTGLLDFTAVHDAPAESAAAQKAEPRSFLRLSKGILGVSAMLIVVSIITLPGVDFEYDFGKLDPAYEEYQQLQNKVRRVYNDSGRRNPAYIVVDDPAEAPAVEAAVRAKIASDTLSPTIAAVESMQSRFPMTPEAQQVKLMRIAEIRALLDDPLVQATEDEDLDRIRLAASTTAPITLDEVPEFLKATFTSKDGQIGRLVIVYPSLGLSHGRNSMAFSEDVGTIETADGNVYHAGSTSLVAADMLRLMQAEAPYMVGLTILLIIVFKFLTLHSIKWSLIALTPLLVGFVGMFGVMQIFGVKLNFYNLVVLPAVLGIGDDAGIHIAARYLEEGRGSILKVLRSTGEHITMSALTSMVGFGGLVLSFYPGMRSIGQLAVIGIGMTLLTALVFLPALLKLLESRKPVAPVAASHQAAEPVQVDEMA